MLAVTRYAPGDAAPGGTDAVTGGRALLTLLTYLAVFVAVAAFTVRRRDIA